MSRDGSRYIVLKKRKVRPAGVSCLRGGLPEVFLGLGQSSLILCAPSLVFAVSVARVVWLCRWRLYCWLICKKFNSGSFFSVLSSVSVFGINLITSLLVCDQVVILSHWV